jgi:O6-methylguanine-DNA--protein-cysteine methyltransferase
LRHRLEQRWHYALPIADKKRQSDRTNSAATRTRRRTRRAYPGDGEVIAAVKRYFEGEEIDFSGVRLDLGEQDPFFERIYAAAWRVAWGHTT